MAGVFKPDVSGSGGTAASQTQQETGTAIDVFTSPGRQQYHPSAAKAWVFSVISGGVPAVTRGYNVTSITDHGTGDFSVNFTTAFSDENYCFVAGACQNGSAGAPMVLIENRDNVVRSTTAHRIYLLNSTTGAATDAVQFSCSYFGDQ